MSVTTYKSFEELPLILNVDEFASIARISRKVAYSEAKKSGLCIKIGEKRLVIPRDRLIAYLNCKEDVR